MYKLKQNVILKTICLLIYTSAMPPQQNIKYCNNLQINEKQQFNINKINKEINENLTQPITNILTDRGSDLHKEELKSSYVSDIFRSHETDLRALNIPFNSKQNNLNILSSVTKTKVDNKQIFNNNENTFKITQFNEPDLSDFSTFYSNHNNNLNILNTAIKSLNNNQNKTEINLEGDKQEKIENLNDKSLKESLNLNTPTTFTTTSTTPSYTSTEISTTTLETNLALDINTSSTTGISTKIPDTSESPDSYNPTTTEIISTVPANPSTNNTSANDEIILSEIAYLSSTDEAEQNLGQKIQVQRSAVGSDVGERSNSAGAEILRNVSLTCGSLFGKRISFANQTTLMEFPWTALLLYNTNIRYHCGGSLITQKYVLTAAHCVAEEFYELSGVRLGEHDITENPDCAPDLAGQNICATTVDADIVKIIIHHAFSHLSFKNDIALLQLDKEYSGRSFYPICLPKPNEEYNEKQATVAGWGATQNAIRSAVLLKAEVPVLDMSRCREIYRYSVFNDSTEICGSGVNEVDVCKGDSGGALFLSKTIKSKEKFFQLGIISLGVRRCGDTRFLPAVFTKVQGFYKWIENNLES